MFILKTHFQGFPGLSVVKNLPANEGDTGLISAPEDPTAEEQLSPCTATTEPALKSLGAAATEPACLNEKFCAPTTKLMCPRTQTHAPRLQSPITLELTHHN